MGQAEATRISILEHARLLNFYMLEEVFKLSRHVSSICTEDTLLSVKEEIESAYSALSVEVACHEKEYYHKALKALEAIRVLICISNLGMHGNDVYTSTYSDLNAIASSQSLITTEKLRDVLYILMDTLKPVRKRFFTNSDLGECVGRVRKTVLSNLTKICLPNTAVYYPLTTLFEKIPYVLTVGERAMWLRILIKFSHEAVVSRELFNDSHVLHKCLTLLKNVRNALLKRSRIAAAGSVLEPEMNPEYINILHTEILRITSKSLHFHKLYYPTLTDQVKRLVILGEEIEHLECYQNHQLLIFQTTQQRLVALLDEFLTQSVHYETLCSEHAIDSTAALGKLQAVLNDVLSRISQAACSIQELQNTADIPKQLRLLGITRTLQIDLINRRIEPAMVGEALAVTQEFHDGLKCILGNVHYLDRLVLRDFKKIITRTTGTQAKTPEVWRMRTERKSPTASLVEEYVNIVLSSMRYTFLPRRVGDPPQDTMLNVYVSLLTNALAFNSRYLGVENTHVNSKNICALQSYFATKKLSSRREFLHFYDELELIIVQNVLTAPVIAESDSFISSEMEPSGSSALADKRQKDTLKPHAKMVYESSSEAGNTKELQQRQSALTNSTDTAPKMEKNFTLLQKQYMMDTGKSNVGVRALENFIHSFFAHVPDATIHNTPHSTSGAFTRSTASLVPPPIILKTPTVITSNYLSQYQNSSLQCYHSPTLSMPPNHGYCPVHLTDRLPSVHLMQNYNMAHIVKHSSAHACHAWSLQHAASKNSLQQREATTLASNQGVRMPLPSVLRSLLGAPSSDPRSMHCAYGVNAYRPHFLTSPYNSSNLYPGYPGTYVRHAVPSSMYIGHSVKYNESVARNTEHVSSSNAGRGHNSTAREKTLKKEQKKREIKPNISPYERNFFRNSRATIAPKPFSNRKDINTSCLTSLDSGIPVPIANRPFTGIQPVTNATSYYLGESTLAKRGTLVQKRYDKRTRCTVIHLEKAQDTAHSPLHIGNTQEGNIERLGQENTPEAVVVHTSAPSSPVHDVSTQCMTMTEWNTKICIDNSCKKISELVLANKHVSDDLIAEVLEDDEEDQLLDLSVRKKSHLTGSLEAINLEASPIATSLSEPSADTVSSDLNQCVTTGPEAIAAARQQQHGT
ncbi:hypothetical protein O998_00570 [Anaplasma phagocytophilum str. Norway variant1]|uniref:Uncharacterized protein n=1 Tax=Anaplasma phagocytophilum str. Norway variant1 TaxID=1392506 RepID=A0A7H9DXT2_ANAPH|nr:hypothetical protein [Anaplasma phagocytophilum]QLL66413.1 hypothetical protein O998_00570 [Anaplasma phagocytophilum str. Norway variant1]